MGVWKISLLTLSVCVCVCLYIYNHHDVVQLAQISLTLSHQSSLSSIASGKSSRVHPVYVPNCCTCEEVHRKKEFILTSSAVSYMSYLSNLDVLEMGGKWSYSFSFVGYYYQDLFKYILVRLQSCFFSIRLDSIHEYKHKYG